MQKLGISDLEDTGICADDWVPEKLGRIDELDADRFDIDYVEKEVSVSVKAQFLTVDEWGILMQLVDDFGYGVVINGDR